MTKRPFLISYLAILLGLLLLAFQSTARGLDRFDDPPELHKRVDLNTLYNAVPNQNKVPLGGAQFFKLDLTKSSTYTTAYFYGCTVVIAVDGEGVTIGHFAQEQAKPGTNGQESCVAMTDQTVVKNKIISSLEDAALTTDYSADTRVWILTSSGATTIGYRLISQYFEDNDVLAGNIVPFAYTATSAFTNFESGPIGKAVVEVVAKSGGGATINVYIQSDTPSWSGNFDSRGRLVPTTK